jgi:hypothetical protein
MQYIVWMSPSCYMPMTVFQLFDAESDALHCALFLSRIGFRTQVEPFTPAPERM